MKHARSDYDRIQDPSGLISADEPVFLLRAQDRHFIPTLMRYAEIAEADGADREFLACIYDHIALAHRWQSRNPIKAPDLPKQSSGVCSGS